jgi:hypothetical protein
VSAWFIDRREILRDRPAAAIAADVSAYVMQDETSVVSSAQSSRARSDPSSARNSLVTADASK